MKTAFFGNSKYSVIVASVLHKKFDLTAVVTIPDRPIGRKKTLTPSPVKQFATEHNIPVIAIDSLSKSGLANLGVGPLIAASDFLVVADYGLILPDEVLAIPKFAPLNVHHSLLPKYRGPSPAPTAILNGEKISGVTIIKMTDTVDAGPILAQKEYVLKPDETTDSLLTSLNTLGGGLVIEVIANYQSIKPAPQDETKASLTKHMTKQDGYIDLANPPSPEKLDRMIRGYFPWPNVWARTPLRLNLNQGSTLEKEHVIKFLPRKVSPYEAKAQERILIQVEGGKPMSVKDFLNGYPEMKGKITKLFSMSS